MASAYRLKTNRDYGDKTRIDMNQSYQVAYWKERFGVTVQELGEGYARRAHWRGRWKPT